jgi:hypothetical protein
MKTHKVQVIWQPNKGPQTAFLATTSREALYGGAAGGGKTDAIMVLPFYRCHNPKHRSIIFRRTRKQLQELIDRQQQLYPVVVPGAKWNNDESRWYWPAGGFTQMGYMEHEADRFKFKTFEYDLVAFDELTSFTEKQYLFMFSRNRTKDKSMPPIVRGGTNPGDVGHQWVYDRFVANREPYMQYESKIEADVEGMGKLDLTTTLQFIPAKLGDNPKMADREAYVAGLKLMGEEDAAAYLDGNWNHFVGQMFKHLPVEGPALPWTPGSMVVRAMDVGWADPLCIHWWRVHRNGQWECLHELYGSELTLDAIAHYVHAIEQSLQIRPAISVIGADAKKAEGPNRDQNVLTMLAQRGVWFEDANRDHKSGWAKVRSMLDRKLLYVRHGAAPNLMRTMPNLVRDPKKPDDLAPRQEDHAAECLRYAVMALPESGLNLMPVVPNEKPQDADPVFAKIMKDLTKPQGGQEFAQLGLW